MIDPFAHLKRPAPDPCPHGNGANCECQLPIYAGLFVVPMEFKDGKGRHVVVRVQLAHDGGMVQFTDPLSGEVVGSGGIYWFYDHARVLEDWAKPEHIRPPHPLDTRRDALCPTRKFGYARCASCPHDERCPYNQHPSDPTPERREDRDRRRRDEPGASA